MIGTGCTGSCKSINHAIMTAPIIKGMKTKYNMVMTYKNVAGLTGK
jgi:hypothetical protein